MPFPATMTLVTVAIQWDLPPGGGARGYVDFTAPYPLLGAADGSIIPPFKQRAHLTAAGAGSIQLPATNDPQWSPTGWAYTVTARIGGQTVTGTLQLDYQTASVQLADLLQVDGAAVAGTSYILTSQRSVASGVAGLDADGDVISAAGTKILAVSPSGTVVAETSYGAASTAGVATTQSRGDHSHGTPALGTTGTTAAAGNHAHADYLPLTGGTITGNIVVQDAATPTKSYAFRTSGSSLDIDAGGADLYASVWSGAGLTGTQHTYLRLASAFQTAQAIGNWIFGTGAFSADGALNVDPTTGICGAGLKNSLANIRIAGFKATTGAPTTGTWVTADVVLDSAGTWHLCTAGGTPGTWTSASGGSTVTVSHGYVSSGNVTPQTTASFAALTGGPTFAIAAAVGDRVELDWSALKQPAAGLFWDVCVLVGGSPVRYASSGTATPAIEGDPSLYPDTAFRPNGSLGMILTAASGDISGGNVTFGIAVLNPSGGGTLYAGTAYPLRYRITNYGPA